jgi:hypothetical protein
LGLHEKSRIIFLATTSVDKTPLEKITQHKINEPTTVDIKTVLDARSDKTIKNFSVLMESQGSSPCSKRPILHPISKSKVKLSHNRPWRPIGL